MNIKTRIFFFFQSHEKSDKLTIILVIPPRHVGQCSVHIFPLIKEEKTFLLIVSLVYYGFAASWP